MTARGLLTLTGVGIAALSFSAVVVADEPVEPAASVQQADLLDDVVIEGVVRGEAAVEMLADAGTTAEVAASVDLSHHELVDELRADPALFVTEQGRVGYIDVAGPESLDTAELAGDPAALAAELLGAPADVCNLQSRPAATRVLYLDFTGHTTPAGRWGGPIVSERFTRDVNPAFSPSERAEIYEIWQRVSEDFAPFDINVTTRDPGSSGLRRTSAGDVSYGQRMVISPTNWMDEPDILGIAHVGLFDDVDDDSAFVFVSDRLPDAAAIADALSHEAGHTLGLWHHGVSGQFDYYIGHGGWAPIMGYPIGKPVTQWSKGEYANASRPTQDDLVAIGAHVAPRVDDWPNTPAAAASIPTRTTINGVIGTGGDVDAVKFTASGRTIVRVRPTTLGSDLRARIELIDGSGSVLASADSAVPDSTGDVWEVDLVMPALPAGTYTVRVSPIGYLNASTGFTAYGSLGGYELVVWPTPAVAEASATAVAQRLSTIPSC